MSAREELAALAARVGAAGVDLTEDSLDRLSGYVELLRDWSARVNLISRREIDQIVTKHVGPSLVPLLEPPGAAEPVTVVDIGSGGGFPGVVLALCRSEWRVHLIEPRRRKALFLERATANAPNATVWRARSEACEGEEALAARAIRVTARAVAPPHEVWPLARPFLSPGGELFAFVQRQSHDALAATLVAAHEDVEVLTPLEPDWCRGSVLRARARR